jgi:hypothetical protein
MSIDLIGFDQRRGAMLIIAVKSFIVYIPVSIESKSIIMDICEVTKTIMPLKWSRLLWLVFL